MLSVEEIFSNIQSRLSSVMPDAEIYLQAELVREIEQLKKDRNAVILGHNYMEPALYHTVPDFKGDSLQLARCSAETSAEMIVFCGVEFMAETAAILSPEKTVLVPSNKAGCSLASSITAQDVRDLKARYPGVPVVTYINTHADVKAESDICCTSGNAAKIVKSLQTERILFIPDEFLAKNIARETGCEVIVPGKNEQASVFNKDSQTLIGWPGRCEVHEKFTVEDIENVRKQFPETAVLAHPECPPDVCEASDFSGSTSEMIGWVQEHDVEKYLLLTECAMGDNIVAENPEKDLLRLCNVRCPHMAQITLKMTRDALLHTQYKVEVDEGIRVDAVRALDRMLAIH
ncbi:MAG: quinolinate synthase NadA [Oligoflexales bacterium]